VKRQKQVGKHIFLNMRERFYSISSFLWTIGKGFTPYQSLVPKQSPWLNPIEPKWVHGKRAVVEPAGLLSASELAQRVCAYLDARMKLISLSLTPERSLENALGRKVFPGDTE
jgi:hypothetical protein